MATNTRISGNSGNVKQFSAVPANKFFALGEDDFCKIDDARALNTETGDLIPIEPQVEVTQYDEGTVTINDSFAEATDIARGDFYTTGGQRYQVIDGGVMNVTNCDSASPVWSLPDNGDVRPAASSSGYSFDP